MDHSSALDTHVVGAVRSSAAAPGQTQFRGHWDLVCRDKYGREKWRESIDNIVVNAGLDHALDTELSGGTQVTTWYIGLTSGSPTVAAGNTLASHGGWTEVSAYDESGRQEWTDGGVSSQSVSNSGSPATFTINADDTTVGGAFLCSASSGTSGTLYAAGAFTAGDKSLDSADTLNVTFTATAAAA